MATINSGANDRSVFPASIDSFTEYSDDETYANSIDAEIWNKLMTVILRIEEYLQNTPRFAGPQDCRILTKRMAVVVGSPTGTASQLVTFTAAELAQLPGLVSNQTLLFADVHRIDTNVPYRTAISGTVLGDPEVTVRFQHLDPSNNVAAGTYYLQLTAIAV